MTATTNDLAGLLAALDAGDKTARPALIDWLKESGHERDARAIAFFLEHAGHSYGAEGPTLGRLRCAVELAEAERWANEHADAEWMEDDEADRSWLDDGDDRPLFGCIVSYAGTVDESESLWGIDLGPSPRWNDPYKRVVEAELASQLMARMG